MMREPTPLRFDQAVDSWRRILASIEAPEARWKVFSNVAHDLARFVARGTDKAMVVDTLHGIAEVSLADMPLDDVQTVMADAISHAEAEAEIVPDDLEQSNGASIPETGPRQQRNGQGQTSPPRILSKAEFLKGFVPPDYLVDGILQRKFVYALTGQTGHAKTALALLIAQLVSSVSETALGVHRVEHGRVVYFVGENPDDIRMRLIGSDALRGDEANSDSISFIPGVFNIGEMAPALAPEIKRHGGVDLVIVDTSAAYFLGQDEISNTQMGAHARMLRTLTALPGNPTVLVLCHPIKHATEPAHLLPRGGGAFLAEMDGNLTLWRHDDTLVELHHNKIRGPGFEPMTFRIEKITTPKLVDSKKRPLPTVRVVPASEKEEDEQARGAREEETRMLRALAISANRSIADLARACGWKLQTGEPHKSKAHRVLERLAKARLVKNKRGHWQLTEEGKKEERQERIEDRGGAASDKPFAAVRGKPMRQGVPCAHCGSAEGEIFKIRDARVEKGKYESLHEACAEPWFCGEPAPANEQETHEQQGLL